MSTVDPTDLLDHADNLGEKAKELRAHAEWIDGNSPDISTSAYIDFGDAGQHSVETSVCIDVEQLHRDDAPAETDTGSDFEEIADTLDAAAADLVSAAHELQQMAATPAALSTLDVLAEAAARIRGPELRGFRWAQPVADLLDEIHYAERSYPGLGRPADGSTDPVPPAEFTEEETAQPGAPASAAPLAHHLWTWPTATNPADLYDHGRAVSYHDLAVGDVVPAVGVVTHTETDEMGTTTVTYSPMGNFPGLDRFRGHGGWCDDSGDRTHDYTAAETSYMVGVHSAVLYPAAPARKPWPGTTQHDNDPPFNDERFADEYDAPTGYDWSGYRVPKGGETILDAYGRVAHVRNHGDYSTERHVLTPRPGTTPPVNGQTFDYAPAETPTSTSTPAPAPTFEPPAPVAL